MLRVYNNNNNNRTKYGIVMDELIVWQLLTHLEELIIVIQRRVLSRHTLAPRERFSARIGKEKRGYDCYSLPKPPNPDNLTTR